MGPHLISLLRGARWEGAPGSAGAGAVAADRRRAIARSRRLSSALSAARAAGGHRAAHREYGDVPLERSATAVHAQTGCLSSWPNCGPKCASTRARLPRSFHPGTLSCTPRHARHPSRPSPRTTLSERECQRPHLRHEPRAAPAASPPAPALFAVLAAAPRGTESSFWQSGFRSGSLTVESVLFHAKSGFSGPVQIQATAPGDS